MGARAWALLSMIVGCLLVVVAMAGAKSEAIYLMDRVVRVDTAGPYGNSLDGASRVLTTMSLVHMLLFMGLIVFFISLLGITATQGRHKCTAAVYGVSSASCAAVILMMSMQILQRVQVTQPIMDRQVQHLCNASTYIQLGAAQHCFWASKYGAAPPCEAACSWKVTVLQNGCKVMPQLCESFQYQAVENCTSGFHGLSSNFFIASTNASACRQACDADIQCQDFAHLRPTVARPELCLLFSGTQQLHPAPAWSSVAPSQATAYFEESTCWKRGDPTILARFASHNLHLAVCSIVLAVVLAISTCCAFQLMYNMNHRRENKPDAVQLGRLMCCPCCIDKVHRRFQRMQLSDESSEES